MGSILLHIVWFTSLRVAKVRKDDFWTLRKISRKKHGPAEATEKKHYRNEQRGNTMESAECL